MSSNGIHEDCFVFIMVGNKKYIGFSKYDKKETFDSWLRTGLVVLKKAYEYYFDPIVQNNQLMRPQFCLPFDNFIINNEIEANMKPDTLIFLNDIDKSDRESFMVCVKQAEDQRKNIRAEKSGITLPKMKM